MATEIGPLLTVADLDVMPDDGNRYELIEGELLVSRAGGLTHQIISGNFFSAIREYLDHNPIGIVVVTPGVIFDDFNSLIPDLIFIGNEQRDEIVAGEHLRGAPALVVEILSPGSTNTRRVRVSKRQVYGMNGVQEYWIVDPENRAVEVYRLQGGVLELAHTFGERDTLTSPVFPGFVSLISDLFRV